jgi:hypothetical protein
MISQPPDSTSTAPEGSDYEKDRVAWNLPPARPSSEPAWRTLEPETAKADAARPQVDSA